VPVIAAQQGLARERRRDEDDAQGGGAAREARRTQPIWRSRAAEGESG